MTMMTNCDPRIEAYMEAVETGKVEASKDVKALMQHHGPMGRERPKGQDGNYLISLALTLDSVACIVILRIKKLLPMIATRYYQSLLTLSMHDHHYLAVLFGKL